MRHLIPICMSWILCTFAAAHADRPATHGMLVVGESKVYLSHLPMFAHSVHAYQVILEAKLPATAVKAYQDSKREFTEKIYTLVPEMFVLPEMVANPRPFRANLFRGHFERGGKMIAGNIQVQIERVIFFKKFDAQEGRPKSHELILFGDANEQFAAHHISQRPDFDQVLSVSVDGSIAELLQKSAPLLVIPAISATQKLTAPLKLPTLLKETGNPVTLEILAEIYLEFGDLQ